MNYLLTQDEYRALTSAKVERSQEAEQALLSLCRRAAAHIPVERPWAGQDAEPEPWGCILNEVGRNPGYCDDCPAKAVCPYPHKRFSQ